MANELNQTTNQSDKKVTLESNLSKLSKGLLLTNIKKEMSEPGYTAIDRITKNRTVIQRRSQYCNDIERVLTEAELTTKLMMEVSDTKNIGDKSIQPEEIIIYYNGIFLDQVHQIKDKLFRLIDRILLIPEVSQDNRKKDPRKLKTNSFMKSNEEILKKIGIYELLQEWTTGDLKVVLNKRTNHHHFVSTLQLNEDYQKIKMSRIMLTPSSSIHLSEYGNKRMKEIGEEYFGKWQQSMIEKQSKTLEEVQNNIEEIAGKLVDYYQLPNKPEEIAEIVNKYTEFLGTFDIENLTSIVKIDPTIKEILDDFVKFAQDTIGEMVSSIYLVGSSGRGEFVPGCSEIDLYVILKDGNFGPFNFNHARPMNVTFISETMFLSKDKLKDRFICWSDGLCLLGKKYDFDKDEFPKPGTLLCLLLNRGIVEKLEKIKETVIKIDKPSRALLRKYSLIVSKIMLDFDFGVAMSNKPFYSASRKRKIQYTREVFGKHRRTNTFEQIYLKGIVEQKDFPMLIDTFLEKAKVNYEKLLAVEKNSLGK